MKTTKTCQIVLTGSSWGIRNTFYCFIAILISTLLVVTTICLRQDRGQLSQKINAPSDSSSSKCDLFSGKWVFDNESYPLYKEQQCTFMSDELACEKFGRKDLSYQNWRRKPHQYCDLPRCLSLLSSYSPWKNYCMVSDRSSCIHNLSQSLCNTLNLN